MEITDFKIQDYLIEILVSIGTIALSIVILVRLSCTNQREIPRRPVGTVSKQSTTREVPEENAAYPPAPHEPQLKNNDGQGEPPREGSPGSDTQLKVYNSLSPDTQGEGASVFVVKGFHSPDKPSVVNQNTVCSDHKPLNPDQLYQQGDNLDTHNTSTGELLIQPGPGLSYTGENMDGACAQLDPDSLSTVQVPVSMSSTSQSSDNSADLGSEKSSASDHGVQQESLENDIHMTAVDQCETRLEPTTCKRDDSSPVICSEGHTQEAVSVDQTVSHPKSTDLTSTEASTEPDILPSESTIQPINNIIESEQSTSGGLTSTMTHDKTEHGELGRKTSLKDDNGNDVTETKWGIDSEGLLSFSSEYNPSDLTRLGSKTRNRRPVAFIETDTLIVPEKDSLLVEKEPNGPEHQPNHALFADHGDMIDDHVLSSQAVLSPSALLETADISGSERDAIADRPLGSKQDVNDIEKDNTHNQLDLECMPKITRSRDSVEDSAADDALDAMLERLTEVNYEHSKRADDTLMICKDNLPNFSGASWQDGEVFGEKDFDSIINSLDEIVDGNKSFDDSQGSDSSEATTVIDCFGKTEQTIVNQSPPDDRSTIVAKCSSSVDDVAVCQTNVDPPLEDDTLINKYTEQEPLYPCGSSNIERLTSDDSEVIPLDKSKGGLSHPSQDITADSRQAGFRKETIVGENRDRENKELVRSPAKGRSHSNPDITDLGDMTANMFQTSKTFWLNKSSPSVMDFDEEEHGHDQDTGYSTANNSPERTRRLHGNTSGADSLKVTRKLVTLRRSNSSAGSSTESGKRTGTTIRRTQSSASHDTVATRVRLRRQRPEVLSRNEQSASAAMVDTQKGVKNEGTRAPRDTTSFGALTEEAGRERTGSVVQEQVRRFSKPDLDTTTRSSTTTKPAVSGLPLSVTIQTTSRSANTAPKERPASQQSVPIIDKGKERKDIRLKRYSAPTPTITRESTTKPSDSTPQEAVRTEGHGDRNASLVEQQVRRFSQPVIPDVSQFHQAAEPAISKGPQQLSVKESPGKIRMDHTEKSNDVIHKQQLKDSKMPEAISSVPQPEIIVTKQSSASQHSEETNKTQPVKSSTPSSDSSTPTVVLRESTDKQDAKKRDSKILQEQMDDYKKHVKFCLEEMTKQLDKEREEKNRAQEWCGFLECELDAHINARIIAEERYARIRAKSRGLTMKYHALQNRHSQLEQYLTSQGVNIDDVIKPNVALNTPEASLPAEFSFLEEVTKQQSKNSPQSVRDRQVFRSVTDVQAYWQEQFSALSAKRGPDSHLNVFLSNVQSTTQDPEKLFLEQMALYNQCTDPNFSALTGKPGSPGPSSDASERSSQTKLTSQTTPIKAKVESPSVETGLPSGIKTSTQSREQQTPVPARQPVISRSPEREPAPPTREPVNNDIPSRPIGVANVNGEETCVKVSQALRMWEQKMSPTKGNVESHTRPSPRGHSPTTNGTHDSSLGIKLQQWEETLTHPPIRQSPPLQARALDDVQTRNASRPGGAAVSRELLDQWEDVTSGKARPAATEEEIRHREPAKSEDEIILQEMIDLGNTDVMADSIGDTRQTKAKWETLFANGSQSEADVNLGSSNEFERSTHFTDLKSRWQNLGNEESNC